MKELLQQAFIQGIEKNETYFPVLDNVVFNKWFESNKHLIDSAIEKYLQEQGKVIISEDRYDDLKRVEFNNPPQYPFDY